jgi:hypothetical protein
MSTRWQPLGFGSGRPEMPRASYKLKPKRASVIKIDARIAWILPVLILFSQPFIKAGDYSILVPALAATIACTLAVASVGYSPTSFVSIVALTHLLFYPLAAWGNLMLPTPFLRWDLWLTAKSAMWGCTVGILALGLGAFIGGRLARPPRASLPTSRTLVLPTFRFNLMLVLLIVPVVFIRLALGVYYHSSITTYDFTNSMYLNLLEILLFVSHAGIFLQTFRYCRTRSRRDGYWAIAFLVMQMVIFMPSGSRGSAFGFTPLLFLAYLSWESSTSKKLMAVLGTLVLVPALIYGIGHYRNVRNVDSLSFNEKLDASVHAPLAFYGGGGAETKALGLVIARFSDYCATGRVIDYTPDWVPYRGDDQLDKLWQIFVPGFLGIIPDRINLDDGAELCNLYGITVYKGSSSPIMIIGDLFSRWGWPGVFLGMVIIGFILRQIDLRILFRWDTFTILFYVLFGRQIVTIVSTSLVNIFVLFARDLVIMALLAYLLARLGSHRSSIHTPYGGFPVSRRPSGKIEIQ